MFEKYNEKARRALFFARYEASKLGSRVIETEHILLGLLREGEGVAARVLKSLDVDIERTRKEILRELDPQFSGGEEDPGAEEAGAPSGRGGGAVADRYRSPGDHSRRPPQHRHDRPRRSRQDDPGRSDVPPGGRL